MSLWLQVFLINRSRGDIFFLILMIFPLDLSKSVKLSYLKEMARISGIVLFLKICKSVLKFAHFPSVFHAGTWRRLTIVFIHHQCSAKRWQRVLSLTDKNSCPAKCRYFVLFLNSPPLVFNVWKSTFSHVFPGQMKRGKKEADKSKFSLKDWWNIWTKYHIPLTSCVICAA